MKIIGKNLSGERCVVPGALNVLGILVKNVIVTKVQITDMPYLRPEDNKYIGNKMF